MRRGLNDDIHGDRSAIRHHKGSVVKHDNWKEDWKGQGSLFKQSQTWGENKTYTKTTHAPSCYHNHPPMKLPGTESVIYGGSCIHPVVKDADVYIGFDGGMEQTKRQFPWHPGDEVLFKIQDMSVPSDVGEFRKLVEWTALQLKLGRKVHCGCIGGHGRTGTFLAALVAEHGEKDAINYVRQHYCQKAVESASQIKFLHDHFGVQPAKATKSYSNTTAKVTNGKSQFLTPAQDFFNNIAGNGDIWS
jgi:hypothetical protein